MVAYDVAVTNPDTLWEEGIQKQVAVVLFSEARTKCTPTKETKNKIWSILIHYSPWIWIPLQPGLTATFFPKALLTFFFCEWVFSVHTYACSTCLPFAVEDRREHWVSYNLSYSARTWSWVPHQRSKSFLQGPLCSQRHQMSPVVPSSFGPERKRRLRSWHKLMERVGSITNLHRI